MTTSAFWSEYPRPDDATQRSSFHRNSLLTDGRLGNGSYTMPVDSELEVVLLPFHPV